MFKRMAQQRRSQHSQESEGEEPVSKRQKPVPAEPEHMEQGRPHQAFVEAEAGKFRQAMETGPDPAKRVRQDVSAAAAPAPSRDSHYSDDRMRLKAVAVMVYYAQVKGWVKPPYSNPFRTLSYVDALVKLADDTDWLAREIPLPAHPEPHHPTIFYTVDKSRGFPNRIPRKDSLIRADYVHTLDGQRISRQEYIQPWPVLEEGFSPERDRMLEMGWDVCYTLSVGKGRDMEIKFHWARPFAGALGDPGFRIIPMRNIQFGPHPPS